MEHHRPRALLTGALFAMATMVALLAWTPEASAYAQYTPAKGGTGNCASCHGDFNAGTYSALALADPATWPADPMAGHNTDMLQSTCAACHGSGAKYPVLMGSSNDAVLNMSCMGCHGRVEDANALGPGNGWGAGLRQAHFLANRNVTSLDDGTTILNTQICADCHSDADPINFTTVAENTMPVYYSDATIGVTPPTNPCTAETVYGTLGLDNDGDGLVDLSDADCLVNNPPTADAGSPQTVSVGQLVTLDGSLSSDPDVGDTITYAWTFSSVPGGSTATLTGATTVNPTFTPDLLGDYIVQLIVTDAGLLDSAPATVTITTANSAPTANAGPDQSQPNGATVTLDGSGSGDVDPGQTITYAWTITNQPVGSTAALTGATTVNPSFVIDVSGAYEVQLIVTDNLAVGSTPDVVLISTANTAPVANAGPDQTGLWNDVITLNGSGSTDVDGDTLTYSWTLSSKPAGSTTTLSNPAIVNPTFVIDVSGAYVASLVVNDGAANSAADPVTITTNNTAPVANAGPDQSVAQNSLVTLNGGGSTDVDGDTITYSWSILSGPDAPALTGATTVNPTFTATGTGTYTVQLIVTDNGVGTLTGTDTMLVSTTGNTAPVANAGPDQAAVNGATVTLDGSGSSDVDLDTITYAWSFSGKPAGSTATLANPTTVAPSFIIDVSGSYSVQLIVNDGALDSAPDTMAVTTNNSAPVANAGPDQSIVINDLVTLDGSGSSDVDLDTLSYSWSLTSVPVGSTATLSNPALVGPTFTADKDGTYVAQLIVTDNGVGTLSSAPATVTITTQNVAPVANAGPDQPAVTLGGTVTLDGSGSSDANPGDTISYAWSFTSQPVGSTATLTGATTVNPTFVTDVAGQYVVQLIVTDDAVPPLSSPADSVIINTANTIPVANAGPDQNVTGGTVTLDGSGSSDADGNTLTYSWAFTALPAGSTATLTGATTVNPTFVPDADGTYTVRLIVNDGTANSIQDTVNIIKTTLGLEPNIVLAPTAHDFGTVLVGTTRTTTVNIRNEGTDWLNVTGLTMSGADFVYSGPTLPFSVQTGRQVALDVDYTPGAAGASAPGSLTVTSNDADTPSAAFSFTGSGVAGTPDINLPSAALAFGDAEVGTTQTGVVSIQNLGTATLNISGLSLTGGNADYALVTSAPLSIAVGYSASVEVQYSPSATGADADTLTIVSDDPVDPSLTVSVSGNGITTTGTPDINLPSATLAFGDVEIGTTNRGHMDIQNLGSADLNITGLALTGSGDFILSNPPAVPFIIKAGRQIRVKVHYLPSVAGPASASLDIVSNDPVTANVSASLSGNALASTATPDINLPTASLVFGDTVVGSTQRGFVDIQNLGGADLNITGLTLTGSGDFILGNPPAVPFIIRSGRQARIKVEYTASVAGPATAALDIVSNDPLTPNVSASFSGNGIAGTPDINLPSATLAVGDVETGASQTGTVLIQNFGTGDLTVSGLSLTGGNPDFVLNTAAPFTVPAGYQATVAVTYSPSATGADIETLQIVSDDPLDPILSVSLSGNGIAPPAGTQDINLPTTSIAYGDLLVGKMKTASVAIQNLGTADLNVTGLTLTGSADFALAAGTPTSFVVTPGRQVTVKVNYSPSVTGPVSGSLAIASDDPVDTSLSVSLSGNGLAGVADINLPVVSHDYGDVVVGASSSGYIAIQNPGTADLTVTGLAITGSADFALAAGTPTTFVIAAGRQLTIKVNYTPLATGIVGGTLTVTSDDPVTPSVSVTLSGNGAPAV